MLEFTDEEVRLMRELNIAVFRGKLIFDAQPPITFAQLAEVEKQINGEVPPGLVALWRTSFGGQLDYDFELSLEERLIATSLCELFYPDSNHYRDLEGWIDHERYIVACAAERRGDPIPSRAEFLPFGGFEYVDRFYVSLRETDYGSVHYYQDRLEGDIVAEAASSIADLFDRLGLNENPFDSESDDDSCGMELVKRILEVESEYPRIAEKLTSVVRESIVGPTPRGR